MSNEIATYSMILSKLSLGKSGAECPTKTQILAINSLIIIDNASTYGANECVKIDDIRKKVETWNYYLTVSPTSMSFGAGGGSKSFTVSSYKRKVLDGVEQSGDTSVSLKSTTISGTGFSLSGTTVSASANEITSNRTGTVTITQNESNKTVTISLSQDGDDVSSYGEWTIAVSASPTSVSSSGGTSTITASAKRTVYWASGNVTEETGNPTLSTNLGSLSSSSSPSTLTLGENTSTSSRTATIRATYGGKTATCTVTQSAGEITYGAWKVTITANPTTIAAAGGTSTLTYSAVRDVLTNGTVTNTEKATPTVSGSATGFTRSGATVTAANNTTTSSRSVTYTATHEGKSATCTVTQSAGSKQYASWSDWTVTVSANPTTIACTGGTSTITASATRTRTWTWNGVSGSGGTESEKGTPALSASGTGFSLSGTTLTASNNTTTSSRSCTVTATYGGKTATCTVTQSGATPSTTYTFSINPYKVNVGSSGGSGSVTISSYKTVGSSTYDVDYSIDSSTLPSWASFNKSTSTFTIQSTTSTTGRTARVYFDQDESGKRDYAELTQTGYTPPADTYVFTWHNGSTSNKSESFQATGAVSSTITLVSTKNGSNHPWSTTSHPSWITIVSETATSVTIQASNNTGSARSGSVVLTQEDSDKTLTINVSQDAYVADTYVFTITPNTYDASYSSASFIPKTVSTKNGSNIGYSLTSGGTDWVVVSTTGKITVEILKNNTSNTRSTTLVFTQNESGKTQSIKITQSGYSPTYTFNVLPTNVSVTAAKTNKTLTVESYKTVHKSDGSETTQSLDYEFSSDTSWVKVARITTNTKYITCFIAENLTVAERNAKITLTQAESGAQAFTNVIQAGKVQSINKLTITSITYDRAYLFPPGVIPVVGSTIYLNFLIPNTFTWETSSGLTMNRGTAYAGDTCNIYVFENNEYRLAKSFTLQTGEQTISF